jgi:uncharacterized protein (TIGR03000 family)
MASYGDCGDYPYASMGYASAMPLADGGLAYPATETSPMDSVDPTIARVEVLLPDANADLWLNGQKMSATGASRLFYTPPLEPGRVYHNDLTASWNQDGRRVNAQRKADVCAGDAYVVDFTRPATAGNDGQQAGNGSGPRANDNGNPFNR